MKEQCFEIPPVEVEVERKTIETLQNLMERFDFGQLSDDAYQLSLKTVNAVTRGLIDESINNGVDEALLAPFEPTVFKHVYCREEGAGLKTLLLQYQAGCDYYSLTDLQNLKCKKAKSNEVDPIADAYRRFQGMRVKLNRLGFKEVK